MVFHLLFCFRFPFCLVRVCVCVCVCVFGLVPGWFCWVLGSVGGAILQNSFSGLKNDFLKPSAPVAPRPPARSYIDGYYNNKYEVEARERS